MANLTLTRQWVENIYQLETSDPVMGGPDGIDNRQAKELGARTNWLKDQVDTINQDLTGYAPKASPAFTGIPTAPTAVAGTNNAQIATTAFVKTAIAALVGSAPAALDTLEELAQALAGETNIKATLLAEIGKKANASHTHTIAQIDGLSDAINARAPSASPTFSGTVRAPTPAQTVNDTTVATTAYVRAAIAALVGTAPATLDTLSEIANALAEDKNVKATLLAEIGKKANFSHTHTVSQITDFNQATSQIINTAITYQKIGNVEIRKYPDGTMIQTGLVVFTREGTTVHTDLVLPIAYVDKEYRCFITERYESRASGKGQYNWVFMQAKTNTTATVTSWYLGTADWMTIGRWK
ncbi:hypothetical protein [Haemophilus haemolyticus]|nr:hypothetical protein [Haemophilus haemolyticus]NYA47991.1 hypothetical protein [Haemophilus haemolyticus]